MTSLSCSSCSIDNVVVYTEGAMVTRCIPYTPQCCGSHEVCIKDLRGSCDTTSIRVVGNAEACYIKETSLHGVVSLRCDVESSLPLSANEADVAEAVNALKSVWKDYQTVLADLEACTESQRLLQAYTKDRLVSNTENSEKIRPPIPPHDALERLEWHKLEKQKYQVQQTTLKQKLDELHCLLRYYINKIPLVECQGIPAHIAVDVSDSDLQNSIRRCLDQYLTVKTISVHFIIDVFSLEKPLELKLVYQPFRHLVSWQPAYDIRPTARNKLSVTFAANIFQRSDEDWNNVTLSLSTVDIDEVKAGRVPELPMESVGRAAEDQPVDTGPAVRRLRAVAGFARPELSSYMMADTGVRVEDAGASSVSYLLPERVTVEAKPMASTKVTITSLELPCSWIRFVAPCVQPNVVILCRIENASKFHLLESTTVSLFTGLGVFIGYRSLKKRLPPGKSMLMSFGDDVSVDVKYIPKRLLDHGSWMTGSQRTRTYQATTYIRSTALDQLHKAYPGVLDIIVAGFVYPSSADSKITVKLQSPDEVEVMENPDDMKIIVNEQHRRNTSDGIDPFSIVNRKNNHVFYFQPLADKCEASIDFAYNIVWSGDKDVTIQRTYIPL